jgi:hypothetical protein
MLAINMPKWEKIKLTDILDGYKLIERPAYEK